MKQGEIYLVVTFSSPIGEKNVTTNLMKHKGKNVVVAFSSPIGKKMLQQFAVTFFKPYET